MVTKKQEQEHEITDQVTGKLHEVVDKAADSLGGAEERIRREAHEAGEKFREGKQQAQVRVEDVVGTVSTYVRENPLTALGIAFVAGSLISSLTRRR